MTDDPSKYFVVLKCALPYLDYQGICSLRLCCRDWLTRVVYDEYRNQTLTLRRPFVQRHLSKQSRPFGVFGQITFPVKTLVVTHEPWKLSYEFYYKSPNSSAARIQDSIFFWDNAKLSSYFPKLETLTVEIACDWHEILRDKAKTLRRITMGYDSYVLLLKKCLGKSCGDLTYLESVSILVNWYYLGKNQYSAMHFKDYIENFAEAILGVRLVFPASVSVTVRISNPQDLDHLLARLGEARLPNLHVELDCDKDVYGRHYTFESFVQKYRQHELRISATAAQLVGADDDLVQSVTRLYYGRPGGSLGRFVNLQELRLGDYKCNTGHVVAALPKVQTLYMLEHLTIDNRAMYNRFYKAGNRVFDCAAITAFRNYAKKMHCRDCIETILAACPNVQTLSVCGDYMHACLNALPQVSNLHLQIIDAKLNLWYDDFRTLARFPSVRHLQVSSFPQSQDDAVLHLITLFPKLKSIVCSVSRAETLDLLLERAEHLQYVKLNVACRRKSDYNVIIRALHRYRKKLVHVQLSVLDPCHEGAPFTANSRSLVNRRRVEDRSADDLAVEPVFSEPMSDVRQYFLSKFKALKFSPFYVDFNLLGDDVDFEYFDLSRYWADRVVKKLK